jgi:hypothetical protein
MPDPLTIGALAASALAMAGPEVVKAAVGEAVKDAYKGLKDKVAHWASGEVATLEEAPGSKGKQLAVAEIIDARSDEDKQAMKVLAENLLAKLKENAPAIGLDVARVTDLEMELGKVTVTSGIGVRVRDALGGKLKTGDISVGGGSGK